VPALDRGAEVKDLMWLAVPMVAYFGQALTVYAVQGRWGMTIAMLLYCIGNIGLMMDVKGV
jgi:hypothetical protein